jgi:DNA-directed RNA polymerase specialized sigma24 family protein
MKIDKPPLEEHYRILRSVMFSDKYKGMKPRRIQTNNHLLCQYLYGDEYDYATKSQKLHLLNKAKEIAIDEICLGYMAKGHYHKYDGRHSLSTWAVAYIDNYIRNEVRRYRPRSSDEGIAPCFDVLDEKNKNFRASYEDYQNWLNVAEGNDNPESILMAKELLGMMLAYFGEREAQVLLGMASETDACRSLGLNRKTYRKRLSRLRLKFLDYLYKTGYLEK